LLTADLVRARRHGGELRLSPLTPRARARARQLAEAYLSIAQDHVGGPRGDFDEACEAVLVNPRERKLALGIRKMVEDLCAFEADDRVDSAALRRTVFERAAAARRALGDGERFDREALLAAVAAERGLGETPSELEAGLYTDLPEAHVLRQAPSIGAAPLVDGFDLAQAQAVLLRATRVVAEVRCASPATYRHLFGKLKFHRLLYTVRPRAGAAGYVIEIDGPYSLFSAVTKYGLQLALVLPALRLCDEWTLEARVLWGKGGEKRVPLTFSLAGGGGKAPRGRARARTEFDEHEHEHDLPDEVVELVRAFRALEAGWSAGPASDVLDLPGLGVCVPDLCFVHDETGEVIYLEVLGFWSREAVWKRVELVQAGLPHKVLFAVPKRLRVSEAVLDDDLPGALYVYKGKMNAREVLRRLEALAAKA
jgi:predicted nuclease of restriction endonuclease-like RecB superfamily